jgi:GNAT superfamily N-acetyltransferase
MRLTALRPGDESFVEEACRGFLDEHLQLWSTAYGLAWSEELRVAHREAVLPRDVRRLWEAASKHERNLVAVLRDGDTARGAVWGEMTVHPYLGLHVGIVGWIWIEPSIRGHGHGGSLVREVKDWAAMQGCHHVELSVIADNAAAVNMYTKEGFSRVDLRMLARLG